MEEGGHSGGGDTLFPQFQGFLSLLSAPTARPGVRGGVRGGDEDAAALRMLGAEGRGGEGAVLGTPRMHLTRQSESDQELKLSEGVPGQHPPPTAGSPGGDVNHLPHGLFAPPPPNKKDKKALKSVERT